MRDPYSILGVKRSADADEIKAAWRTKAKTIHPDHNRDDPSATDRFAEVGQAYELLKDPERRRRYDRAAEMHQTIMQQREEAERAKAARAKAEKVMEELAKAQAARAQPQPQAQAQAQGPKPDAAKAGAKTAPHPGAKPGESPEETIQRIFGGSPEARERAKDHAGQPESATDQKPAEATSKDEMPPETRPPLPMMAVDLISNLVKRWRGTAVTPEKAPDLLAEAKVAVSDLLGLRAVTVKLADEREVRVPIERGATDGQQIRLAGQGLKLANMKQGDLVVTLRVERDDRYMVKGFDLHTILPISLQDAVLGNEAQVETPTGLRTVEIPSWSGSDRTVTIPGLGLYDDAGGRGNLVVELRIVLLETPDAKVTDLMRLMRDGLYL
jgi:curved DNA-binding protein CbpA